MKSPKSNVSRRSSYLYDKKQILLPICGLNIFKKLIFNSNNNINTEQYITEVS